MNLLILDKLGLFIGEKPLLQQQKNPTLYRLSGIKFFFPTSTHWILNIKIFIFEFTGISYRSKGEEKSNNICFAYNF
jgi:hypothetical protein